jgi:hypothetical protein
VAKVGEYGYLKSATSNRASPGSVSSANDAKLNLLEVVKIFVIVEFN